MTRNEALKALGDAWSAGVAQGVQTGTEPETATVPYKALAWMMNYIQALEAAAMTAVFFADIGISTENEPYDQVHALMTHLMREHNL